MKQPYKQQTSYDYTCILSNNDKHPVTKIFTPHHYTCRHFTSSHINFTQLHFTTLHYPLIGLNSI